MNQYPEWVQVAQENSTSDMRLPYNRLIKALMIAWDALEVGEFNYEQTDGGNGPCGKALRLISHINDRPHAPKL